MKSIWKIALLCLGLLCLAACNQNDSPPAETSAPSTHLHSYTDEVIAPTCDTEGYTLHTCTQCHEQYRDRTTPALGHSYTETVTDTPCNQYQKLIYTCSTCAHTYEESLTVKGTQHDYKATVTYPNRENGGYTTHTCKNCTASYVDGHTEPVDFSVGLAYTKRSGKYYVSGIGSCKDTAVVIPSVSEQGYTVAGIMENAFQNSAVTSILVSDGVLEIESYAFAYCSALQSVTLPKNAKVSENLFAGNPNLTTLTMPMQKPIAAYFRYGSTAPNGYKLLEQGNGSVSGTYYGLIPTSLREIHLLNAPVLAAFSGCDMLTKITIPTNATAIGASAFNNCTGLTEFTIPDSVRTIGARAFRRTSITSVTIPKNVKFAVTDGNIFEGCTQLRDVTILSSSACLPPLMFLDCSSLTELEIPDCVTLLGGSFIARTSVKSIKLPSNLTELGTHTFSGCEKLESVILPNSLKVIDYGAFQNCIALETIELPSTVERIGYEAFAGCVSLKAIDLPDGLQALEHSAFENCTALTKITLPRGIQVIEESLFAGCTALSDITLHEGITKIKPYAFEGSGVASIAIPANVTLVGTYAFHNCTSLKTVDFLGDHAELGNGVFLDCTALEAISIPKCITKVPYRLCKGAVSLKKISFAEGLISIGEEAFMGCTDLEELTLPQSLKAIENQAFMGCSSLQTVDFSNAAVTSRYSQQPFADCTSLTEVKNYDGIEAINVTFFQNTPLQTVENGMTIAMGWLLKADPQTTPTVVTVPQGVTKIHDYAFSACKELQEVIIPEGVVYLGLRIFGESNGMSLTKLTLPDSLTSFSSDTVCFLSAIDELEVGKGLQTISGNWFGELSTIRFRGTVEEFRQMPWCENSAILKMTIICSNGTVEPSEAA